MAKVGRPLASCYIASTEGGSTPDDDLVSMESDGPEFGEDGLPLVVTR